MDKQMIDILLKSRLCKGMNEEQVQYIVRSSIVTRSPYHKNQVIFFEGDEPEKLYILISGGITICRDTTSGKRVVLTNISTPGDIFGEVYLFINKKSYGVGAVASEPSVLAEISKEIFLHNVGAEAESDYKYILMENLLQIFAAKAFHLSNKVTLLGSGSIREKIVKYLLSLPEEKGVINLPINREAMALELNVTRPSLSREFSNMKEEGILSISGSKVKVLDRERFEEYI